MNSIAIHAPDHDSHTSRRSVERVHRAPVISAAMRLASSTSGPGCGTKIVSR
jgi:hypothetical protein